MLLGVAALAGCTLIDQTTFNPNAGKSPGFPVAPVVNTRVPPGPPAFLTLRMSNPGNYQDSIAEAVQSATARRPTVEFDVVQITPPDPDPAAVNSADTVAVARAIEAQGVPARRIHLLARPEAGAEPREVRVYVR